MSSFGEDETIRCFDEEETYHPLFCVTSVPDDYCDDLNVYASQNEVPWLEITTSNPANILSELRKPEGDESSNEPNFVGWEVEQVYDFYAANVRPAPNSSGRGEHFTAFTFVIVDEECVRERQMLLCSDAPDYGEGEGEVKLKTLRVSLRQGLSCISPIEQLALTPSEAMNPGAEPLKLNPIPTMQAVAKAPGDTRPGNLYRIASPAEARANKRRGIVAAENGS